MAATVKLIEVYVDAHGPVTIHTLSEELELPLLAVIPAVECLCEAGQVSRDGDEVLPARTDNEPYE